jgi:hypothetical protein
VLPDLKVPLPWNPLRDVYEASVGRVHGFLDYRDPLGHRGRSDGVRTYSWSIPTPEAIGALVRLSPILEVMAGTGYWAKLIRDAGGDVIATDLFPPDGTETGSSYHKSALPWADVIQMDALAAVQRWPDRTLLLSWPPHGEPHAADAVRAYHAAGGRTVVYIGEQGYGCTGNVTLHQMLGIDEHERCWRCDLDDPDETCTCSGPAAPLYEAADEIDLPQWPGMHDYLVIYRRR